jgi:hypothetical protein
MDTTPLVRDTKLGKIGSLMKEGAKSGLSKKATASIHNMMSKVNQMSLSDNPDAKKMATLMNRIITVSGAKMPKVRADMEDIDDAFSGLQRLLGEEYHPADY